MIAIPGIMSPFPECQHTRLYGTFKEGAYVQWCSECGVEVPIQRLSVGDVKSDAKGSGARYNSGKADFSLLPLCTLEDEIKVWMYGREKYAAWNWAKGMPWSVPLACLLRHLAAWQRGEENDVESGLPHLAHAACNLRMLILYAKTFPEGDDRPVQWMPKDESA